MSEVPDHDEEMSSSSGAVTDETGPTTVEQSTETSIADPEPGSVPLINEQGNPKFPTALLERGGYDMLRMSLNKGLPAWVTAANVLELNVSIETVLLNIVWYALQSQDADLVSMLRLYDWFPSGLLDVHQSKRTVRWDWIMSKDPGEPAIPGSLPPALHCFWAKGFGVSKAKDDMLIKADTVKSLNFKSFRTILLSVSDFCITKSPGPVEVMGLIRRHWNDLHEPSLDNLRSKVQKKKKRIRAKNQAAKKLALKTSSGPSSSSEPPVVSMDQAVDPSTANGPGAAGNEEVARVAEVGQPSVQFTVPGMAPPPPGVNIVRTPLVNYQATPPVLGRQPGVGQPRGLLPAPPRFGSGPHNQGRQRGGGYRGRKAWRSFSRGSRGGYANSGNQAVASNSQSRGSGRTDRGGSSFGPGISWVNCWSCRTAIPSLNQVCSYCHSSQF